MTSLRNSRRLRGSRINLLLEVEEIIEPLIDAQVHVHCDVNRLDLDGRDAHARGRRTYEQ